MSTDENKESVNRRGNKRGMMVDEGVMVEEGKVQGKRVRTQVDQNELNNV